MMNLDKRYRPIPPPQMRQLKKLLAPHGNGRAICEKTGLNINTIKRAAEGLRVSEENAEIIENFLNTITND